ncbi:Outer membrane protein beta-barrel domain-containing protein [Chitinophaga costaii]|uniref:Outer membrane protein beta-barrel domain-containing protein n=1 Tax=Chitinophaga costaii TaxID=1335309 RepID=A0A1C4G4E8_9BACT|nr:outer membrane beta-barrel protein [Chitinophaga costaii]PUZ20980.1 hypothetical protein DCM91_17805 [Chitinophaga costaii]SCC62745.1 Outer membrane protein beta-barrel domain-containing protein [Chitinophaga costaii]
MKSLIHVITASVVLLCSIPAWAQNTSISTNKPPHDHGLYLKIAGGYYFSVSQGQFPDVGPYPPHDTHESINTTTGATAIISDKVLTGSYGAGARGGLTVGWNFNKYVGIEGTFNYYSSSKNLMTKQVVTALGAPTTVLGQVISHGYVHAVDFAPSVIISPGYTQVNPYLRFGVVVPLWGRLNIETKASQTSQVPGYPANIIAQTTISRHEQIKPNITIGFQGALGVSFALNNRLDIFVEAEYRNVPVYGKSKEVTAYEENTVIINTASGPTGTTTHRGLGDLSTAERYTDYKTTLDQNSNTATGTTGATTNYKDNTKPSNDLKSYINIGGLGANVGLKFKF